MVGDVRLREVDSLSADADGPSGDYDGACALHKELLERELTG